MASNSRIADFTNRALGRFDLRIAKASSVDAQLQTTIALSQRTGELTSQIGRLQQNLAELGQRVSALDEQNRILIEQNQAFQQEAVEMRAAAARQEATNGVLRSKLARLHHGPSTRPRIVIVMTTLSQTPQLKAIAGAPRLMSTYSVVVVSHAEAHQSGLLEFCRQSGLVLFSGEFELLCGEPDFPIDNDQELRPGCFGASATYALDTYEDQRLLKSTVDLLADVNRQTGIAESAQGFLLRSSADLLMLFEDNVEWDTGIWVNRARSLAIPSVIVPYAIIDQGDAAEAHYNDPGFWADETPFGKFVKTNTPQWALEYRGRSLLRRNALGALASEALGFAPVQPWVWNSSNVDVIAVESHAMREIYRAQHVPEFQIELTGSLSDDQLFEAARNSDRIRGEFNLDARRPVLLCAFPPNQLSVNRSEPEFQDFQTLVQRWLGELSNLDNWQVIIKPHPAMRKDDVDYLRTFHFPVTDIDTASLVPVCDLFNTSVSSTIRWALACGKPVLNYDVYRYRYQDFVGEPAVVTVFDYAEFAHQLRQMTTDSSVLEGCRKQAESVAAKWGMLDGRSTERLVTLLDRLTGRES